MDDSISAQRFFFDFWLSALSLISTNAKRALQGGSSPQALLNGADSGHCGYTQLTAAHPPVWVLAVFGELVQRLCFSARATDFCCRVSQCITQFTNHSRP